MSGYFCVQRNSTYGVPTSNDVMAFNVTLQDPDSGWDGTSVYTIPASWDGRYALFNINLRCSSAEIALWMSLEVSVDGGTIWTPVSTCNGGGGNMEAKSFMSKPLLMVTGDKYRATCGSSSSITQSASGANNFNACCLGGYGFGQDYASLGLTVNQNITSYQDIIWEVSNEDSNSLITAYKFVIPVGYPKSVAIYHGAFNSTSNSKQGAYLDKSGGFFQYAQHIHSAGDIRKINLITEVVAGDIITQKYWNSSGTKVLQTNETYSTLTLFNVE